MRGSFRFGGRWLTAVAGLGLASGGVALAADPFADEVLSYDAGTTPSGGRTVAASALGSPTRLAGVSSPFGASVVSPFSPPYWFDEIVSIGEGGHITLRFDEPITNAATNAYGVDLLIFGNGFFVDFDGDQRVDPGDPPPTFGQDAFRVEVSADGATWYEFASDFTESLYPTQGYLDGGAYDGAPGSLLSDFTRPVNPAIPLASFKEATLADIRALYAGSGGGTPVDIAASGLAAVSYVRLSLADDGDSQTSMHFEVDGLSAVPEPGTLAGLGLLIVGVLSRRR